MFELKKRGKNKVNTDFVLKDIYKDYLVNAEDPYKVSFAMYTRICKEFNIAIINSILENAQGYKMPVGLGTLYIRQYTPKDKTKYPIDFHTSMKLGRMVRHLNDHTHGKRYFWNWLKKAIKVENKEYYIFHPTRSMSRTLAKMIKEKKMTYMQ